MRSFARSKAFHQQHRMTAATQVRSGRLDCRADGTTANVANEARTVVPRPLPIDRSWVLSRCARPAAAICRVAVGADLAPLRPRSGSLRNPWKVDSKARTPARRLAGGTAALCTNSKIARGNLANASSTLSPFFQPSIRMVAISASPGTVSHVEDSSA